ncbi:DUF421 domain-containing protein [Bacillus sp. Au-Bac7]|uniref:DUF421 domain-containing protein n=1 Tax=Bacillus sp. Au-Bac7 TaxID=2906458 RepID=UPI001E2A9954|nr:DUF421 domain-containing protein [Bacillus sp. Au-Bac7]MCE4051477.1 DUF421 domain-containing protein [Bacillus sp. Au-Bac7]
MSEYLEVTARTIGCFFLLYIGTRILGKQLISQMTNIHFIASISMGTIAANLTFNTPIKVANFILAFVIIVMIALAGVTMSARSKEARRFFGGCPTPVIKDGQVLEENMINLHFTIDYVNQLLREKDIFNIEEVQDAIVEASGKLSVLKKPLYREVTKQDIKIAEAEQTNRPVELIVRGAVLEANLMQHNLSLLQLELDKQKLLLNEVDYAVIGSNGKVYILSNKDSKQ